MLLLFFGLLVLCFMLLVVVFWVTATILLPWTIAATLMAIVSSLGLAEANRDRLGKACVRLSFPLTVTLTIVFGFAACWIYPPKPPPLPPAQNFFGLTMPPPVGTSAEEMWSMLPVHLFVAGLIGGAISMALVRVVLLKDEEKTIFPLIAKKEPPAKLFE